MQFGWSGGDGLERGSIGRSGRRHLIGRRAFLTFETWGYKKVSLLRNEDGGAFALMGEFYEGQTMARLRESQDPKYSRRRLGDYSKKGD